MKIEWPRHERIVVMNQSYEVVSSKGHLRLLVKAALDLKTPDLDFAFDSIGGYCHRDVVDVFVPKIDGMKCVQVRHYFVRNYYKRFFSNAEFELVPYIPGLQTDIRVEFMNTTLREA